MGDWVVSFPCRTIKFLGVIRIEIVRLFESP